MVNASVINIITWSNILNNFSLDNNNNRVLIDLFAIVAGETNN